MQKGNLRSYVGRPIAIDASCSIYQFLTVVGRNGTEVLTNQAGEPTSHLYGLFYRTVGLLDAGLKPVYVFDGKPPDLKRQEMAKREDASKGLAAAMEIGDKEVIEKFSKRTVMVTKQHNDDCKKLLGLMGIPSVQASSEAEPECAALCKSGKVYAVSSEDMDTLTFGAPRFLRHLMGPSSKVPVVEFHLEKILTELNLTMDQFIDLCMLCGCDYCPTIRDCLKAHSTAWFYGICVKGLIKFLVEKNGFCDYRVTKAIQKIEAAQNKSFTKQVIVTSSGEKKREMQVCACGMCVAIFKDLDLGMGYTLEFSCGNSEGGSCRLWTDS
ncbi:hypothetical protein MKW98_003475 [Papaver atlanticum]|uniref:Flap endonuclease 1 n=1 Tax=Papaver atlanticum TaxID=357466 RepID=A0AAD4TB88_9MAGN|nr:hypothetical protein MKW98_003475 [Papaver atlanticum]